MLFSISYILLGFVAVTVVYAIPVDTAVTYPGRQTHPTSSWIRRQAKDKIHVRFLNRSPTGTGCPVPQIKQEMTLILEKFRQSINVNTPFEFLFQNRYDEEIDDDEHDFEFWGEGVGEDCETNERSCEVMYNGNTERDRLDPETMMATISAEKGMKHLLVVNYDIRHNVKDKHSSWQES
ncbi:hypothetical protein F5890DRAFT_1494240 [Lentinula detonsa]|uniref:Uncharacterized protein n=1 Tax=Lentinula detonsa TaxID=2804962 RepID=A0AA38Q5I8_9AGAR|nr:hypothetical protein F5890DRAFT_1494240 [Lentinula detonsa]